MTAVARSPIARTERVKRRRKLRPVPTVLQMEAAECGAACLAMILASFGARLPLEQLRIRSGVTRDGSKASNLLKAARSFGLDAKGYKKEPSALRDLPWPLILHWNFNHYIVFEGMNETHAYINDPASGRRKLSIRELDTAFTGVALAFAPSPHFRKTNRQTSLFQSLRARVRHAKNAVLVIALFSLMLVVLGIVLPVFSKIFVDGIIVNHQAQWIIPLFLLFAATASIRAGLTAARQSLVLRMETKLALVGSASFLWHVLYLPMTFFSQRNAGEIATRIDASQQVAKVIAGDLMNTVIDWGTIIAFAVILVAYDATIGAITIGLALPNLLLLRFVQEKLTSLSRSSRSEMAKLGGTTVGIIHNIETIKASGLETSSFERWAGQHGKVLKITQDLAVQSLIVSLGPDLFKGLIQVSILGIGAYKVLIGAMTVGDLIAFQSLAESFSEPLKRIVTINATLNGTKADLDRVEDALRYPRQSIPAGERDAARMLAPPAGDLELENISFGYSPLDAPFLKGISLTARPGDRLALVGRSGCGKSTLGRLIAGLIAPSSGEIRLDNLELGALDQSERARRIAYVDQDVFLFEGTVRDNLTLWNNSISDETLTRALDDAAILDEIVGRPGELDTFVEEGGRNFSGGQRQRLEIARALVCDPCLLVLDEATAALDPQIEAQIDENLRRRGCTCIIIAHRLSTIRDCSEIVLMQAGGIVERGTHDELMVLGGQYADLIRSH